MDFATLENRIKKFEFSFLNYISNETKELSNKVIVISCVIIFINFNVIILKQLELGGLTVEINEKMINIIFLFINTYFFLQYRNSIRIDIILLKIPDDHKAICEAISNFYDNQTRKINELKEEYEKALKNKDFSTKTSEKLSLIKEKIEQEIPNTFNTWIDSSRKSIVYKNHNLWLNQYFPTFCFFISLLSQLWYVLNSLIIR